MKTAKVLFGLVAIGVMTFLLFVQVEEPAGPGPQPPGQGGHDEPGPGPVPSPGAGRRLPLPPEKGEPGSLPPDLGRISGRLLTPLGPATGARVEWLLARAGREEGFHRAGTTVAGPEGRFLLGVPPGMSGTLRLRHRGYPPAFRRILTTPAAGRTLALGRIELRPGCTLTVQVFHRRSGRALAGAALTLARPPRLALAGREQREVRTDAAGLARIEAVAPGAWRVTARAEGLSPRARNLVVGEEMMEKNLSLYLGAGPGLAGRITGEGGHPLAGATVTARPLRRGEEDPRGTARTRSDGQGRFRLGGLEIGHWSLTARAPGRATPGPVKVTCPAPEEVVLATRALPRIRGRLIPPAGSRLEGARVALSQPRSGGAWVLSGTTPPAPVDDQGRFVLKPVRHPGLGPWVAVAWDGRHLPGASEPFHLDGKETPPPLKIHLAPAGRARGRVTPPGGAQVNLVGENRLPCPPFLLRQPPVRAQVDEEGAFTLEPLAPGPCLLRVQAPGRAPKKIAFTAVAGKTITLAPVTLESGTIITGLLQGPTGKPEAGGLVCLMAREAAAPIQVTSDEKGRFRFPPVEPGRYILKACRREADPFEAAADFAATRREIRARGEEYEIGRPIRIGGR